MITAGIDMGAKFIKVVLLKNGAVLSKVRIQSGMDQKGSAVEAFDKAVKDAGIKREEVVRVCATGAGRKEVPMAGQDVTEVSAAARGIAKVLPQARTIIDVGAEEGRGVRIDEKGKVIDFAINEKCAAGAGAFTEAMARALEVPVEDLGALSLKSDKTIPMNAQCAVFAESEVVTLVHAKTPKEDIARAVHDAIASRITSMVRRVGVEPGVVLIGGVAKNIGFVDSLKRTLETDLTIPEDPDFISALGAAAIAAD